MMLNDVQVGLEEMKRQSRQTAAMRSSSSGFTLVELMIVLAIISIVAVTALPMYAKHVTRSKASSLIVYAESLKPELVQSYSVNGYFPQYDDMLNPRHDVHKVEFVRPTCNEMWAFIYPNKEFHESIVPGEQAFIFSARANNSSGSMTWGCLQIADDKQISGEYFPASCRDTISIFPAPPGCQQGMNSSNTASLGNQGASEDGSGSGGADNTDTASSDSGDIQNSNNAGGNSSNAGNTNNAGGNSANVRYNNNAGGNSENVKYFNNAGGNSGNARPKNKG